MGAHSWHYRRQRPAPRTASRLFRDDPEPRVLPSDNSTESLRAMRFSPAPRSPVVGTVAMPGVGKILNVVKRRGHGLAGRSYTERPAARTGWGNLSNVLSGTVLTSKNRPAFSPDSLTTPALWPILQLTEVPDPHTPVKALSSYHPVARTRTRNRSCRPFRTP